MANGQTGSISGTLAVTSPNSVPPNGNLTSLTLAAKTPSNCQASESMQGTISSAQLSWTPGNQNDSCSDSPLASTQAFQNVPASPLPPTTY
jgi:hypothetical protein